MEDERCPSDDELFELPGIADIKENPGVLERIRWNVTPQMIMEPRFQSRPEDLRKLKEVSGYMFYIETQCEPPALMLMKVSRTDIMSTVGNIAEIPEDLIRRAIENPVEKPTHGMYAITEEIKDWLKKKLGV